MDLTGDVIDILSELFLDSDLEDLGLAGLGSGFLASLIGFDVLVSVGFAGDLDGGWEADFGFGASGTLGEDVVISGDLGEDVVSSGALDDLGPLPCKFLADL